MEIADDAKTNSFVRGNALIRIGAICQRRAYEYLISRWNRMTANDPYRINVILALGSGPRRDGEHAGIAVQKLRQILESGSPEMRYMAAISLGDIRSAGARNILQSRLKSERDSFVRRVIEGGTEEAA
jgi:HEAT repeat protein